MIKNKVDQKSNGNLLDALARHCRVGNLVIHFNQYGMTVSTLVCCSIISLIQVPYALLGGGDTETLDTDS